MKIMNTGMETLAWYRYEGTTDVEGVGIEMERLAEQMGGTVKFPYNDSECLDADYFKLVADHLVTSNNIRPILHAFAVDVIKDNDGCISGIIMESKSGREVVRAKRVIDCTGDADLAYFSGCPYTKKPREEVMGVTTVFGCSNVDVEKFKSYVSKNTATYEDWSRAWPQRTAGKENHLPSPYLDKEFLQVSIL